MGKAADAEALEFIESDGEPMGETELHAEQGLYLVQALRLHARDRGADPTVHVGMNLFFYWDPKDPRKVVCPDVFFVRGLDQPDRLRRTYKVWEEGRGPDLIVEVASRGTWTEDLGRKKEVYRDVLRAREYVVFDPEEGILDQGPLLAWRLVGRAYRRADRAGRFESRVLGATFEVLDGRLRLVDARGEVVPGDVQDGLRLGLREGREVGLREGREVGLREGREGGLREGREGGLREGREGGLREGREGGLRDALERILEARFGPIAPAIRERVSALAGPALERALGAAATAPSLAAAFD